MEGVASPDEGGRHQGDGDGVEEQRGEGDEPGYGGSKTTAASQEAGKKGHHLEEERHQVHDPAEPPHVEVELGSRVTGIFTRF